MAFRHFCCFLCIGDFKASIFAGLGGLKFYFLTKHEHSCVIFTLNRPALNLHGAVGNLDISKHDTEWEDWYCWVLPDTWNCDIFNVPSYPSLFIQLAFEILPLKSLCIILHCDKLCQLESFDTSISYSLSKCADPLLPLKSQV